MAGRPRVPIEQRFWTKVRKQDGDQCWLWTAAIKASGYGTITEDFTGRTILAHRVSYQFTYGPISDEICVLHKCDVRNCVRPDHLFLGDYHDNAIDAFNKGRRTIPSPMRGKDNPNTKLTIEQVIQIKHMLKAGKHVVDIGQQFHVHKQTIIEIRDNQNWKYISRD